MHDDAALAELVAEHTRTAAEVQGLLPLVRRVADLMCRAFGSGGIVYTFGNGGSAADAQHLTGELIGHYRLDRQALPAVTLTTDPTVTTCIGNDYSFDDVFARQVGALARTGDVVVAFTTSGRSANIVAGLRTARAAGATTVLFSGGDGGPAREHADLAIVVPSASTPRVQEMHTLMLHLVSELVDDWAGSLDAVPGREEADRKRP